MGKGKVGGGRRVFVIVCFCWDYYGFVIKTARERGVEFLEKGCLYVSYCIKNER